MSPYFSIIVPVYDIEDYIEEALGSILCQSFQDFEVIVVNDGSTDGSLEVVCRVSRDDPRVKVHSRPNGGLSAARNTGLELATGKFIYFFDGDDLLEEQALEEIFRAIRDDCTDIVGFSGVSFPKTDGREVFDGSVKPDSFATDFGWQTLVSLYRQKAYSSSVCLYVVSKQLLDRSKLRFDEGFIHEDESFTLKAYCYAGKTATLSHPYFKRRLRDDSIMTREMARENYLGILRAVCSIEEEIPRLCLSDTDAVQVVRARQRGLLRHGRKISQSLDESDRYRREVSQVLRFSSMWSIDKAMLVYVYLPWVYIALKRVLGR